MSRARNRGCRLDRAASRDCPPACPPAGTCRALRLGILRGARASYRLPAATAPYRRNPPAPLGGRVLDLLDELPSELSSGLGQPDGLTVSNHTLVVGNQAASVAVVEIVVLEGLHERLARTLLLVQQNTPSVQCDVDETLGGLSRALSLEVRSNDVNIAGILLRHASQCTDDS